MNRKIPVDFCETYLRDELQYNTANAILPSENAIIALMLERRTELSGVYEELCAKLSKAECQRFLSVVLATAAHWNSDYFSSARDARNRLAQLREDIARLSRELAALLRERWELNEYSGYSTDHKHHIGELIDLASESNWLYQRFLSKKLRQLRGQFDLKYWPSIGAVVDAIGDDAESTTIEARDSMTEAGTRSPRSSKADSFRALKSAVEEEQRPPGRSFPKAFRLTDESYASLINVTLNLDISELVDGRYIKRLRQRDRTGR